jgi:intein/homing endonuclease
MHGPSGHRDLIEVKCSNRSIKCTDNHPFLVKDEGYVKAKDLKVGELLLLQNKNQEVNC